MAPTFSAPARAPQIRGADTKVWAVLGPTNTGKTHLAVERMLANPSGMIGLPLRLLAREVYDRVVRAKGAGQAALITGEERIMPPTARYFIATVEAMPVDRPVSFLAVDEIQLCADPDRGHVFTDRLLHARGTAETMFLGSDTMRHAIRTLVPGIHIERRELLSTLTYTGPRKIIRLPRRTAIVAFSAAEVYAIAELMRRHRGGCAVVMGALSPRTRNAQVALYQSGEVDFLVATDAIGMGLNMHVEHVAFAAIHKFDGRTFRPLRADELAQIAGRAGRHANDGSFGETGDCPVLDDELIEAVESHRFDPVESLIWRNRDFDFASASALMASLETAPPDPVLARVRGAIDEAAFRQLSGAPAYVHRMADRPHVRRLWEACQLPDFRNGTGDEHVELVDSLARQLMGPTRRIDTDWIARRIAEVDREDGDIDQLQERLASVRVWTYAANRADWLDDPGHWQGVTRQVEDRLSDRLHERLVQRFIDRRTSALLRGLKREVAMAVDVNEDGAVLVDGHVIGRLDGLSFTLDPDASGPEEKALKSAAHQAVRPLLAEKIGKAVGSADADISLRDDGVVVWDGHGVARLVPGQPLLSPKAALITADLAADEHRDLLLARVQRWLNAQVDKDLAPLTALRDAANGAELDGMARGFAYRLHEAGGMVERRAVKPDIDALSQDDRRALRKVGVRFGRNTIYLPLMLKPKPTRLRAILAFHAESRSGAPFLPPVGLTSFDAPEGVSAADFAQAGFKVFAGRAIRIDILDRVADALFDAATAARGPVQMPLMVVSLLGVSNERAETVVEGLGWEKLTVEAPPPATPAPLEAEDTAEAAPESQTDGTAEPDEPVASADLPAEAEAGADSEALPVEVEAEVTPVEVPLEGEVDVPETADAPAETADTALAEPADPVMITVWRLARGPRRDGPRRDDGRPPRRDGEGRGPRIDRPHGNRAQGARPQGDRPQGARLQGERPQGDRPKRDWPKGDRPDRGGRPFDRNRGNDRPRDDRPRVISAGPENRQVKGGIDPSNPFAALLALKGGKPPEGDGKA
jgi:ATP-dependent RNA helicase SUPV3L1/SUV3